MPGMSPRIKAKKGRFGVEGLIHTVRILTPATGSSFTLGSPSDIPFAATGEVTDDLGAVTAADIVWTQSAGTATGFNAATDGSPTAITFTGAGTFTLTATVTNGAQVVTDSISGTVTA